MNWPAYTRVRTTALAVGALLLAAEALLASVGKHSLCRACGALDEHAALSAVGAVGWLATLAVTTRTRSNRTRTAALALLAGVHVGFTSHLVLLARACPTCLGTTVLAVLLAVNAARRGGSWNVGWVFAVAGALAVHLLVGPRWVA